MFLPCSCIGGVGVFLIITGWVRSSFTHATLDRLTICVRRLTVCVHITEDDFDLSLSTLKFFLLNTTNLILWVPAFALAVLLRIITHKYHHQLIFPLCEYLCILTDISGIRGALTDFPPCRFYPYSCCLLYHSSSNTCRHSSITGFRLAFRNGQFGWSLVPVLYHVRCVICPSPCPE